MPKVRCPQCGTVSSYVSGERWICPTCRYPDVIRSCQGCR